MSPLDVIEGRARWCVVEGDSAEALRDLPPASCSALVTDPPAGIGFMGREWDKDRGGRAQWVAWLASVLGLARAAVRPGGRAFVWALPRTTHWTGCAVEDAGWSVETVVTHLFGTGWPKGASQLKPSSEHWYLARTGPSTALNVDGCRVGTESTARQNRAPMGYMGNAPAADGYTTGSTSGRWPPNTLFTHSPGCEQVGERRVRGSNASFVNTTTGVALGSYSGGLKRQARGEYGHADPDGTELVEAWRCVEGCPVAELDAQSGKLHSRGNVSEGTIKRVAPSPTGFTAGFVRGGAPHQTYDAGGPASRFFPCFPADDPAQFAYIAKPSRAEKRAGLTDEHGSHPTVKPIALMRWLLRLVTEPGDIVLDPFGGSGTTGVAALLEGRRVILVERDPAFAAICRARLSHAAPAPDFGPLFGGAR